MFQFSIDPCASYLRHALSCFMLLGPDHYVELCVTENDVTLVGAVGDPEEGCMPETPNVVLALQLTPSNFHTFSCTENVRLGLHCGLLFRELFDAKGGDFLSLSGDISRDNIDFELLSVVTVYAVGKQVVLRGQDKAVVLRKEDCVIWNPVADRVFLKFSTDKANALLNASILSNMVWLSGQGNGPSCMLNFPFGRLGSLTLDPTGFLLRQAVSTVMQAQKGHRYCDLCISPNSVTFGISVTDPSTGTPNIYFTLPMEPSNFYTFRCRRILYLKVDIRKMHDQLLRATAYDFLSLSGDVTLNHIDFELVDATYAEVRDTVVFLGVGNEAVALPKDEKCIIEGDVGILLFSIENIKALVSASILSKMVWLLGQSGGPFAALNFPFGNLGNMLDQGAVLLLRRAVEPFILMPCFYGKMYISPDDLTIIAASTPDPILHNPSVVTALRLRPSFFNNFYCDESLCLVLNLNRLYVSLCQARDDDFLGIYGNGTHDQVSVVLLGSEVTDTKVTFSVGNEKVVLRKEREQCIIGGATNEDPVSLVFHLWCFQAMVYASAGSDMVWLLGQSNGLHVMLNCPVGEHGNHMQAVGTFVQMDFREGVICVAPDDVTLVAGVPGVGVPVLALRMKPWMFSSFSCTKSAKQCTIKGAVGEDPVVLVFNLIHFGAILNASILSNMVLLFGQTHGLSVVLKFSFGRLVIPFNRMGTYHGELYIAPNVVTLRAASGSGVLFLQMKPSMFHTFSCTENLCLGFDIRHLYRYLLLLQARNDAFLRLTGDASGHIDFVLLDIISATVTDTQVQFFVRNGNGGMFTFPILKKPEQCIIEGDVGANPVSLVLDLRHASAILHASVMSKTVWLFCQSHGSSVMLNCPFGRLVTPFIQAQAYNGEIYVSPTVVTLIAEAAGGVVLVLRMKPGTFNSFTCTKNLSLGLDLRILYCNLLRAKTHAFLRLSGDETSGHIDFGLLDTISASVTDTQVRFLNGNGVAIPYPILNKPEQCIIEGDVGANPVSLVLNLRHARAIMNASVMSNMVWLLGQSNGSSVMLDCPFGKLGTVLLRQAVKPFTQMGFDWGEIYATPEEVTLTPFDPTSLTPTVTLSLWMKSSMFETCINHQNVWLAFDVHSFYHNNLCQVRDDDDFVGLYVDDENDDFGGFELSNCIAARVTDTEVKFSVGDIEVVYSKELRQCIIGGDVGEEDPIFLLFNLQHARAIETAAELSQMVWLLGQSNGLYVVLLCPVTRLVNLMFCFGPPQA
ncbi:hypothetical protein ACE6H2_007744 [Prunus campanulata]